MKPGKIIEKLEITGISADGKSVGRYETQVIFVKEGAPGDLVDIEITGKKRKFLEGRIIRFHHQSEDRTVPFCEHFGVCGGCKWQHLDYHAQIQHKEDQVRQNLKKIAGITTPELSPIIGSPDTQYYRNKLEYTFSNMRWLTKEEIESGEGLSRNGLGFHVPGRFDKVLDINHCWLQEDISNRIRLEIKHYAEENGLSFFDLRAQEGLLRNLIIRTTTTGQVMVILQFFEDSGESIQRLLDHIHMKFEQITSLQYIINPKKNETFYDLEVHLYKGLPYIEEKMGELTYRIGPKSFYQTNSIQAVRLYEVVREFADLKGEEVVYDLYTGTGTIANFIASNVKKVIGIESVEDAVKDAYINSEINGITNTSFYTGDMKDFFTTELVTQNGRPDLIITDPPRAGMHQHVVDQLLSVQAKKIVYVSCNPATQARDLALLHEKYEVTRIQPVDMFPHTHHVECVVLLELRS